MKRLCAFAIACAVVLATGAEGASRRKRPAPPAQRALPNQSAQEQDQFKSCDVAVREFVNGRREAAALPVKEVKVDGLRMTLNFVHPYGESGETAPSLGFTRGESIEERRKVLNETKRKVRTLEEAAKDGSVWYVIALAKGNPDDPDPRRSSGGVPPDENRWSASAVVFASMEGKCIPVYEYKTISLNGLGEELLRRLSGEQVQEPSPAGTSSAARPPS
jgi:hypothetical protein